MLERLALRLLLFADLVIIVAIALVAGSLATVAVALIVRARHRGSNFYEIVGGHPSPEPELLLAHLHPVVGHRETPFAAASRLELITYGHAGRVGVRVRATVREAARIRAILETIWPGGRLVRASPATAGEIAAHSFRLERAGRILRRDSVAGAADALRAALMRVPDDEEVSIVLSMQRGDRMHRRRLDLAARPRATAGRGDDGEDRDGNAFACELAIVARAGSRSRARFLIASVESALSGLCTGTPVALNEIARRGLADLISPRQSGAPAALAASDVAVLLPLRAITARSAATQLSGDAQGERLLGRLEGAGAGREVRLSVQTSRQHLHVLGATGTGKSTLLLNLAAQDIAAGRGTAVLDPKGDLVHELLARVPRARLRDIVYIGPEEQTRFVGLNPLTLADGEDPDLAAENVLAIFKRIYHENWGPRTDDILKACLYTLVASPRATLAQIPGLLTNSTVRERLLRGRGAVADAGFWEWYARLSEQRRLEFTAPLLNKVRDFLLRPRLRRLLCQERSTVDLRALIDGGGVLLADLATGRWGENASALAGSFLVARLWQAALARQEQREEERRDFSLYIDEFQTFLGIRGPFADALAQARGLRLSLTLANQHLDQLSREVRGAVRANARSAVVFRCGTVDAHTLESEFAPLDAGALATLPRYHAAARLAPASGGVVLATLPPPAAPPDAAHSEEVLTASAQRYGRSVEEIDAAFEEALGRRDDGRGESTRESAT